MFPTSFAFNQSNLQDYVDCPRRFELRHLRQMRWPAVESAPLQEAERRMQLGSDFHRLVHQHLLGLPQERLTAAARQAGALSNSPELVLMWENYLTHRPPVLANPDARFYPEITLATLLSGHRLLAKYDLLAVLPGDPPQILIVDWKTSSRRPPSPDLLARIQSRVYPFVLAQAGASLVGRALDPAWIMMTYWFAAAPQQPERINYSQAQFDADRAFLSRLLGEIEGAAEFPLTSDERACRYCVYRSYCDRGGSAGPLEAVDDDLALDDLDLDWEHVSEVVF